MSYTELFQGYDHMAAYREKIERDYLKDVEYKERDDESSSDKNELKSEHNLESSRQAGSGEHAENAELSQQQEQSP